ncbi:uncharacterized protein LOC110162355 [Boleophthalmus pectinirostris]|uniref:uncharacterized protein LOC110162355 n=1 Tax=Boleophthalmus pectinirostris TaxID=150288 RepID=UPI0024326F97|nr:uncharacterized protein LOC110162355 [Boleophthalmus pectinirostris]XP_055022514.1 uncharacterized protein LOC110162355 [Boleophthalmus pectinirostris]XP_055022515.1 uncharacterized protein LOC110162355 [Boleophthalmus pectinirostris]
MMTSGITSSYTTIQSIPEELGTKKPPDIEDVEETTDSTLSSNQSSSMSPSSSDDQETGEEDNCLSKPTEPAPTDNGESEETAKPIPRPRSKINLDCTENQTDVSPSTDQTTNEPNQSSESTKPPPLESTYVLATEPLPLINIKKNEVKRSSSLPRPERPPPPVGYYGIRTCISKPASLCSDNEDGQESISSSISSEQHSPVSPDPTDDQGNLFGIYRPMTEDMEKPAIPPRPPQPKQPYVSSASLTSQSRPPPPPFRPPPPPSEKEPVYNEIQFPAYLHILPEHDNSVTLERQTISSRSSTNRSSTIYTQEILEMLRWLKVVSKTDYMTPSLYGASLEEEIRSFHQTTMNLKKALRLFNLLMMRRSEILRDYISELTSTSDALDKALKRKKTIQLAGGTTGAVGGVTAVVGLALAPVTLGASLIATAVGAGMVASAGGVSAHVAKTKKKVITRDGIEKLINDYTENVKDPEHCLCFILSGMNEVRRYDSARLQRAGAQLDALKIAQLTQSVFNNMDTVRRNPAAQTGGMSSERLLHCFAKELDYYFTEREGQKLKKSRKSRFSGRVRLLAENLQDELDYLNHMWALFN